MAKMNELGIERKVNSVKLTKLERKVLHALLNGKPKQEYEDYPEGNDIEGIAKQVYGEEVFHCARRGGHYCGDLTLCYAAKSSLSRTLKNLLFKELVKKCKPIYPRGWHPAYIDFRGDKCVGYYGVIHEQKFLRTISIKDELYQVEKIGFRDLPYGCHVWFMLTEKGRMLLQ